MSGTPGESFDGYLVSIESDSGSSQGIVDRATAISGTFDPNGLLTVEVPDLENPSFTVALLSDFTGTVGTTDIDIDDDGIADDLSAFGRFLMRSAFLILSLMKPPYTVPIWEERI